MSSIPQFILVLLKYATISHLALAYKHFMENNMRGKLVLFVLVNIICIHFSIAQDVKVLFVGDMVFQSHVQEMVSKQEDIFEHMNTKIKT